MKRLRRLLIAALGAAAASSAFAADAPAVPFDIELGYRFVDVSGNEDMYRSQINEKEGFLLRAFTLSAGGPAGTGIFDQLRVDAADLGAGPAGFFRLQGGLAGKYDLRLTYRRTEMFSALPAFANPLILQGVTPGEHTYDRVRNVFDVEVRLLPGYWITPIVGYVRNRDEGPGRTTYTVGGDDFRLTQNLDDDDQEVYGGASFDAGPISGQVTQGWRKLHEVETQTLVPGAGAGNNPGTVLGVPVSLDDFNRTTHHDANTPITNAVVTGRLGSRVKLIGAYVRSAAESDVASKEGLAGSLVSFQLSRIFGGLSDTISSRARNIAWRGSGRVEANLADGIDLTAGWSKNRQELDGFALISDLYLQTVTFGGQDPKDLLAVIEAHTSVERTEEVFDARVDARAFGPFSVFVGGSQNTQHVKVVEDPEEIVVPGAQDGSFERRIRSFDLGARYSASGLTLGADWQRDRADDPVVRTDFLDRDRYRLRAAWALKEAIRLSATAEQIDASNDRSGIGYHARIRQYGGEAEGSPAKFLRVRVSVEEYRADSHILFRHPEDFSVGASLHREDGHSVEGGLTLVFAPVSIDGAVGRFKNEGSFPFTIDRASVRASVDVTQNASIVGEWNRDKYKESATLAGSLANYDANRYGLYVRWKQ
jgi:hypothetical protein